MFDFDTLGKMPLSYRKIFFIVLTFIPYYYLALNLFSNTISTTNLALVLSLCFCLALGWFLACAIALHAVINNNGVINTIELLLKTWVIGVIFLSAAILISVYLHLTFKYFLFANCSVFVLSFGRFYIPYLYTKIKHTLHIK